MSRKINSVAVLGGGTMGSGIAGLCAQRDCRVLLLDVSRDAAEAAFERIKTGRPPAVDDLEKADNITLGTLDGDLHRIRDYDWICEAVIEDLATKRALFERLEPLRKDGSVVSTNTSGIPLHAIIEGMPERLRRDIAVTHFFNPVKVMRLMELVPGADTTPDVIATLAEFCGKTLGKGVVHAKDTVNFIGNRIGCFWMLMGLHKADRVLADGTPAERVDALMSGPFGLPPTGLFGLIDLIGLDVMDFVAKNLAINLPADDAGRAFTGFPPRVQAMFDRGQLGRKTGGGFYRVQRLDDGSKLKETFDLGTAGWRPAEAVKLPDSHSGPGVMLRDDADGRLAWEIMGETLCYAAGLVPEIADDIVNIDRAMRLGFAWKRGPFELLDALGADRVIEKLDRAGRELPRMLRVLGEAGAESFYRAEGSEFLGTDGRFHPVPPE
ncbi:MAG: 3-hydroxyacyl-CoA dehydrogenase NAD-binding domain-containing protein [Paracoccaceae bacterium]